MKTVPVQWGIGLAVMGLGLLTTRGWADYSRSYVLPPRPLSFPGAVAAAVDPLNHNNLELFVEHPSEDRISKLMLDLDSGSVVMQDPIATEDDPATEQLITPDDLWRDPRTGDLYVTEVLVNGVVRVSPDGKTRARILFGFGDGNQAVNGVEVDAIAGRYYGDKLRLFVSTFSLDPNTKTGIWEIDPAGILPPCFVYGAVGGVDVYEQGLHGPDALAFNPKDAEGKELFVSEFSGGRLWAIDLETREPRLVYDPALGNPLLTSQTAMGAAFKFDAAGRIYYGEFPTGRILRLDPFKEAIDQKDPEVVLDLEVPGIHNIDADDQGDVFLSDIIHGRITVLPADGGTPKIIGGESLNLPNGILPLPDGRLAVTDLGAMAIVDPGQSENERLSRPWNFLVQNLDLTAGIGMTANGDGYATAFSRGALQYLGKLCEKNIEEKWVCETNLGGRPADILPTHSFAFPADIMGGDGELWVSDLMGLVWHVILPELPISAPAIAVPLATPFVGPTGLAMSPDGKFLYVSESMANQVRIVDPVTGAPLGLITGLAEPEGLAFESDGSLLVVEAEAEPNAESGHGRLTRVKLDGSREAVAGDLKTHKRGVAVIPQFNFFADVAVDGEGDIFITSPEDGSLTRLTP